MFGVMTHCSSQVSTVFTGHYASSLPARMMQYFCKNSTRIISFERINSIFSLTYITIRCGFKSLKNIKLTSSKSARGQLERSEFGARKPLLTCRWLAKNNSPDLTARVAPTRWDTSPEIRHRLS